MAENCFTNFVELLEEGFSERGGTSREAFNFSHLTNKKNEIFSSVEIPSKETPAFRFKLTPLFRNKLTPVFRSKLTPAFLV